MYKQLVFVLFLFCLIAHSAVAWKYTEGTESVSFQELERKRLNGIHFFKNLILKGGISSNLWIDLNKKKKDVETNEAISVEEGKVICKKKNYVLDVKVIESKVIKVEDNLTHSEITLATKDCDGTEEYFTKCPLTMINYENNITTPFLDFTNFEGHIVCTEKEKTALLVPRFMEQETFLYGPWNVPVKITIKSNPLVPYSIQPVMSILGGKSVLVSGHTTFLWPYGMKTVFDAYLMILGEEAFQKGINCFLAREKEKSEVELYCNNWNKNNFLSEYNRLMLPLGLIIAFMNKVYWDLPQLGKVKYQKFPISDRDAMRLRIGQDEEVDSSESCPDNTSKCIHRIINNTSQIDPNETVRVHNSYNISVQHRDNIVKGTLGAWLASFLAVNTVGGFMNLIRLNMISRRIEHKIRNSNFVYPWRMEVL